MTTVVKVNFKRNDPESGIRQQRGIFIPLSPGEHVIEDIIESEAGTQAAITVQGTQYVLGGQDGVSEVIVLVDGKSLARYVAEDFPTAQDDVLVDDTEISQQGEVA